MKLFGKKDNYVDPKSSRYELEMKARSGKPMTADEHDALERYRIRDVWDQIFRVAGVITTLCVIMLAVFIFLYPYSVFNFISTSTGKGDVFWKMLESWHVYVGRNELVLDSEGGLLSGTWLGNEADINGYVTMQRLYDTAFQSVRYWNGIQVPSGFDFKAGVYVIGSWTIVVVATLGFITAVVGAAFILASNIKNLIGVIRHVTRKTGETLSSLSSTAKESYEEAVPESKEKKRKKKDLFEDEEVKKEKKTRKKKEELPEGVSSADDLDKLLMGESIDTPIEEVVKRHEGEADAITTETVPAGGDVKSLWDGEDTEKDEK